MLKRRKHRVLVLDDDPGTCALIQRALSGRRTEVTAVSDPARVLDAIRSTAADVIVLDYVIPALEFEQIHDVILDVRRTRDVHVVVVSGFPTVDAVISCIRARTFDYLPKPFQLDRLRQVVYDAFVSLSAYRGSHEGRGPGGEAPPYRYARRSRNR